MVAAVVAVLQGPLSETAVVVKQSLRAIRNLAVRFDNKKRLGNAGACEGEFVHHIITFSHDTSNVAGNCCDCSGRIVAAGVIGRQR